ncbi:16S rRNA (uracil(1498)-N(3))-methyltransferase [Taibaiella lutea]|uniref:Ribosomal RNA small subunit methyltransferase E n=1 Tax=Taibaiella lutea TaxID=2608001 RepID=A0A5M6CN77_9BACT|nr:RsmE family RNA methyltransferase [Taibaiella lutea]KAA5536661.1 16S rRNA (uracil(1498)-N(3))-methyltransferase [Taibaiella lutea]
MLPYFYHPAIEKNQKAITLDEPTSKHVIQVLRMQQGEQIMLTNGKGLKVLGTIVAAERKRCGIKIDKIEAVPERPYKFTLAISFTKNNSRNEWLLEKATEMGIERIIPVISARTEKEKFNASRLEGILVSAMLQSQQCFLPELLEPVALNKFFVHAESIEQKLIAHCIDEEKRTSLLTALQVQKNTVVLIGPEGDFTKQEIDLCVEKGFVPVTLGANRLRTETAGLYVCTVFNALNYA